MFTAQTTTPWATTPAIKTSLSSSITTTQTTSTTLPIKTKPETQL